VPLREVNSLLADATFDRAADFAYPNTMPTIGPCKLDRCWRKSRIAARILLRERAGRLTPRDVRLARRFAGDKGVTARLIQQAIHGIRGRAYQLGLSGRAAA